MNSETFGAAVGQLIYQRRKAQGLTQTQLAEDAFGTGGKTRRISELESGQVANPHPKTLDPLIVALGITERELEECAQRTSAQPDPDLDRAYREARNLIEVVARQFDHTNPNSSLAELEDYLRQKAKEWSDLRDRIQHIDDTDSALSDLRDRAVDALGTGDFELSDGLLAEAEELKMQHSTLVEVRKLVELRVTRGDINLIAERREEALSNYISAANFLKPFSESEADTLLDELAYRIYDAGRRSLTPSFAIAAKLLEAALELASVQEDIVRNAEVNYRLSLIYRNSSESAGVKTATEFTEKAINYATRAIELCKDIQSDGDEDVFRLVSAEIALGNALFDKTLQTRQLPPIDKAIQIFRASRARLTQGNRFPQLAGHVSNSQGSALMTRLEIQRTQVTAEELDEVIDVYEAAIEAAELCNDFEVWGVANSNLGNAYTHRAELAANEREEKFLRMKGISALLAALETYPSVAFPRPYARAHMMLGQALYGSAMRSTSELAELYLFRAINSYELAAEIFGEQQHSETWAFIQVELSRIFLAHTGFANIEISKFDIEKALLHMNNALRAYKFISAKEKQAECRKAIKMLKRRHSQILADDASEV